MHRRSVGLGTSDAAGILRVHSQLCCIGVWGDLAPLIHGAPWKAEVEVEVLDAGGHWLSREELIALQDGVKGGVVEVRGFAEHLLVEAKGGLGVPDDVLEDLIDCVSLHVEVGAASVFRSRVEVLDSQSVATGLDGGRSSTLHLLGRGLNM